jgi:hypothetical protein
VAAVASLPPATAASEAELFQASKLAVAQKEYDQQSTGGKVGKESKIKEWSDFCLGKTGETVPRDLKKLHYKIEPLTIGPGKEAWADIGVTSSRALKFVEMFVSLKQTKVHVVGTNNPKVYTLQTITSNTFGAYITVLKGLYDMQMLDACTCIVPEC